MSITRRLINQTYFKWYEFEVNVVRKLIATCTYKINIVVGINASEFIVNFNIVDSIIFKIS